MAGIIEGSITLARTGRHRRLIEKDFDVAKKYLESFQLGIEIELSAGSGNG